MSISIFLFFLWLIFFCHSLWSNCHVNSFYVSAYARSFLKCRVKYCACACRKMIEHTIILLIFNLNWDATKLVLLSLFGWLIGWLLSSVYQGNWLHVNAFVCFYGVSCLLVPRVKCECAFMIDWYVSLNVYMNRDDLPDLLWMNFHFFLQCFQTIDAFYVERCKN